MAIKAPQRANWLASLEIVTDSNVGIKLELLDKGYTALVTELVKDNKLEGTVLYIPGISYKILRGK